MKEKWTQQEKQRLVARYRGGEKVKTLCAEIGVSKSSFYEWIALYREIETRTGQVMTPREFEFLRRRVEKLEELLAVFRVVDCTPFTPMQERLLALEKLHGQFSVHTLCEVLDVPCGTFYNHLHRNKRGSTTYAIRREELREQVREIFDESRQLFGAGKIRAVLMERGYKVSEKYIVALMREMSISSLHSSAKHDYERMQSYEKKENVLKRQFQVDEPNRVWVSDVTCFKLKQRWYYICVMIDLFSRRVVAHRVAESNSTRLITTTLKLALADRKPEEGLVFHSDQGTQYTAYNFRKLLAKYHITQSLSKPGTPYDNAVAESFFAGFKKEELYRTNYRSEKELRKCIADYMAFYNDSRPHTTLHYKTPSGFEAAYWNSVE